MADAQNGAAPEIPFQLVQLGPAAFSAALTRNRSGCVLAVVVGEADLASVDTFAAALVREPLPETTALVVDMSGVPFCSAYGLEVLMDLLRGTNQVAVPLELAVDTNSVRCALAVLRLDKMLSSHPGIRLTINRGRSVSQFPWVLLKHTARRPRFILLKA